jgi:hypothetical protein
MEERHAKFTEEPQSRKQGVLASLAASLHASWAGLQSGAMLGVATAGTLLGLDFLQVIPGEAVEFLTHGGATHPVQFLASSAAVHATGASLFEGVNKYSEARQGLGEVDSVIKVAENLDRTLAKAIDGTEPQREHEREYDYVEEHAQHTPRHVREILDRGAHDRGRQFQHRLDAERAATLSEERAV